MERRQRLYVRKGGLRYATTWHVVCTDYPERLAGFCTLYWRGSQPEALAAGLQHAREYHGVVI